MGTKLYKGYLLTKDKKSLMKFKGKDADDLLSYDEVCNLPEYGAVLADNIALIDFDDKDESERMLRIVEELDLKCRVYEATRGYHFVFLNNGVLSKCGRIQTAVGFKVVDVKLGSNTSYEILKYKGIERKIVRDIGEGEEYDTVPKWLIPVKTNIDFATLGPGDGRNQTLFNYILTLQSYAFAIIEARECIRLINRFVLPEPLDDREIETILRDEAFQKPAFFKGREFLFDTFARFLVAEHHIIKINGQLHLYKDGIYVQGEQHLEGAMIKHIPNLNQAKRREVLSYLNVYVQNNTLPSDASFIAFANGVLNIQTDEFTGFSPDYVITNKIGYNYNPNAYSEIVDKMLDKLAVNDSEVRALLEEHVGFNFYRANGLRKFFILTGDKRNGKSTYLDMLLNLLGEENTSALDMKELGDRFKTAELFGKLANIGDDIADEFIGNPAIIKKIVSGDRINVERKGQDPYDFNPYTKLSFSANGIPRIKDKSGALLDRMIIVPFDAVFTPDDADYDPNIKYKLRAKECMEYLIILGIEGLKRVLANNKFTTSSRVTKEIRDYEETNNPIVLFMEDIEVDDVVNQSTRSIYGRYCEFCLSNNFQPMSQVEFSKQIKKRLSVEIGVKRIDGKSTRVFVKK